MKFLIDANVLSESSKPAPNPKVWDWLEAHETDSVIDSIILGEVLVGIQLLPRGRRRSKLEKWIAAIEQKVVCIPWDARCGRRWAALVAEMHAAGTPMPKLDSMIAATALVHGLTLVTRNTQDFVKAGVKVFNPFE